MADLNSEPILAAIDEAIEGDFDEKDIEHESVDPDHDPESL